MSAKEIHQSIHPSLRDRLDPQYVAFHEEHLQYVPPLDTLPWDPACRTAFSPSSYGRSEPVPVGSIRDIEKKNYQLRVFVPTAQKPKDGWPVFVWFHGGGWVVGGLGSENSFLTRACVAAKCVVVSVNYRHAPEHQFPAATDDTLEAFTWIVSHGAKELEIDTSKIAIGGLSAGGGLAGILAMRAAITLPDVKILTQILILPVIDNTATETTVWESNKNAPWLSPARMIWYRRMYMPKESDWNNWIASPNFASGDLLSRSPKTFLAVAELDILCEEGKSYGRQLSEADVDVEVKVYKGSTHSLLLLDGDVLDLGKELVEDACAVLSRAFGLD